ncbi:helix-turn-helix domain-containing protein [Chitinophaga varians]|uniref:helix-turn-helix domain-containing protein n=1 Tax=Chitinophaga varians TaxID=2202339 RepID=UPI00165F1AA1|nr:AraC family transcriptional regulator [Chitinophaga varians]MBC9914398.1 helix-turn-helix transcriptional regulator [Chitinophaga varians]
MEKLLYRPFDLQVSAEEQWEKRPLVYHFFEIVHILEGSGSREVNRNKLTFSQGDTFLFTPLDCRGFHSEMPTRFCSIRFSEIFISQYKQAQDQERALRWLKQLEHIFFQHNRFQCIQITDPGDHRIIGQLIQSMIEEHDQQKEHYQENMQHFISLLLNILARNVADSSRESAGNTAEEPLINRMLVHIHTHIGEPDQLKMDFLAASFHLSANYVSEYFKKFTGVGLQQYISQYRIKLVEQRLLNSVLTIGQIADEFGFTDESHLNRVFRKHHGVSPTVFRKPAVKGAVA